jgi:hypothetical protein
VPLPSGPRARRPLAGQSLLLTQDFCRAERRSGPLRVRREVDPATTTPPPANFRRRPPSTNRARHQRGSPGIPLNAAKVGLKFAHQPKEIDVEPRILGTRLPITRAYRSYGVRVPSW